MEKMPRYYSAVRKLPCGAEEASLALRSIARRYEDRKPSRIDGVRIEFEDSWILVRQSNTEPMIRIYAESARGLESAEELAERFLGELEELLEE